MFSYFILIFILYICICQECLPGPDFQGMCIKVTPSDDGSGRVWLTSWMGSIVPNSKITELNEYRIYVLLMLYVRNRYSFLIFHSDFVIGDVSRTGSCHIPN